MRSNRTIFFIIILYSLFTAAIGCGPSRAFIDLKNQISTFRTVGIMPPDMIIYELTAAGTRELMDEWCVTARKNFTEALSKKLRSSSVGFQAVGWKNNADMEDVYYLFRALSASVPENTTYLKLGDCAADHSCRDYTIGPLDTLLPDRNVDAVLFIYGLSEIESDRRAAARRASRAISIVSVFGPVRITSLRNPGTFLGMALADRSGTVLWHTTILSEKGIDLRDAADAEDLTNQMIAGMGIW